MPASKLRIAAAAIAFAATGIAYAGLFDDDEARKRIEDLRIEHARTAQETAAAADRIAKLEESVRNIGVVQLLGQIEALNAEIARLRGQIEVLANQDQQTQKRQRDFYVDLDSRIKRLETASAARVSAPAAAAPAGSAGVEPGAVEMKAVSKDDPNREVKSYDLASSLFRRGDYAGAEEAFRGFVRNFPQSTLAPNAIYWIGICQANLREWGAALATQEGLLARYPKSSKAPDAMLAIAAVQAEQGDAGSARNTLEDIIARYPETEAAGKARNRLATARR